MFCRFQVLGLVCACLGVGMLAGSIFSGCLPVWLSALALIAAGIFLFRL